MPECGVGYFRDQVPHPTATLPRRASAFSEFVGRVIAAWSVSSMRQRRVGIGVISRHAMRCQRHNGFGLHITFNNSGNFPLWDNRGKITALPVRI